MTRKEVYRAKGRAVAATEAVLIRQEKPNHVMGKAVVKNSSGNTGSSLVP